MPSSLVPQELCTCSPLSRMLFPLPDPPGLCLNIPSSEKPVLTLHSNTFKLYLHTPHYLTSHLYPVLPSTPLIIISNIYWFVIIFLFSIFPLAGSPVRAGAVLVCTPHEQTLRRRLSTSCSRSCTRKEKQPRKDVMMPAAMVGTWSSMPQGNSEKWCKTYAWGMGEGEGYSDTSSYQSYWLKAAPGVY